MTTSGLVALALWVGPASAQTQAAGSKGPQAVITGVIPSEVSPSETRLVLTFNQAVPKYAIVANDRDNSIVAFTDAKLPVGVTPPTGKYGLVQTFAFTQDNGILTMTLKDAEAAHVTATAISERALSLTIKPVASKTTKADTGTGRPPAHTESAGPDDVFEVVPLKYADVSEIVGLLTANQTTRPNDNFNPQEPAFGSAGVGNNSGGFNTPTINLTGANNANVEPLGVSVDDAVGIDRRLNAIILSGPADRVARLKARIAKLDVPVTSVILETVFVELTESGARNVGFNFTNANGQIATFAYQYNRGGVTSNGAVIQDTAKPWGGAALSLQAALSAQVQAGQGRIISKPRIAAQSGSTAKIITGDALPILTSIALSGVNAVQQQVQYVNVGVTLQIAPRVTSDGYVTSHVFAEVSSVTGVSQGYPTISQREASTIATVKDGESFIVGGLTQDNKLSTQNRIPLLDRLPGLSALSRNDTATRSKTDLYIIVTPHVVSGRDRTADLLAAGDYGPALPLRR